MLAGSDDDLAADATRIVNRIRGVIVDVHPALDQAISPYLRQDGRTIGMSMATKFSP
ncbi:IS110 family transposase [Rhodococcus sp. KBS0724]|nr:IS110 family transposase [Rhodococcus sp. KBS0724]TSD40353.1 IS110 family transposase [Rhodococcus sp. KBS0724]